jgi:hypothetical protein
MKHFIWEPAAARFCALSQFDTPLPPVINVGFFK